MEPLAFHRFNLAGLRWKYIQKWKSLLLPPVSSNTGDIEVINNDLTIYGPLMKGCCPAIRSPKMDWLLADHSDPFDPGDIPMYEGFDSKIMKDAAAYISALDELLHVSLDPPRLT